MANDNNESQVNSMVHRNYSILSFSVDFIFFIIKCWKFLNLQVIYFFMAHSAAVFIVITNKYIISLMER